MKTIMVMTVLLFGFVVGTAKAAGGQNRHQNPVIADGPDNCIYMIPTGLDEEKCWDLEDVSDRALSGILCTVGDPGTTIELCPDEDSED